MALTSDFKDTVKHRVARDPSFREEYLKEGIHLKMSCSNWPEIAIPGKKNKLDNKTCFGYPEPVLKGGGRGTAENQYSLGSYRLSDEDG